MTYSDGGSPGAWAEAKLERATTHLLRARDGRWALLGAHARTLAAGEDVTVRGTAAPTPGRPADRAPTVIR